MELQVNKLSFIDEFKTVRNIENRKAKERTAGFNYLHNATTKRLAEGGKIEIQKIDFSKFTSDDLEDYMQYYETVLEPKLSLVRELFDVMNRAESLFSNNKHCY